MCCAVEISAVDRVLQMVVSRLWDFAYDRLEEINRSLPVNHVLG